MPETPKHPVNVRQVDGLDRPLYNVVYFPDYPDHNSIWDLECSPGDGKIYVGLCSECAHKPGISGVCAAYDPRTGEVREAFSNEKVVNDYQAKHGRLPHGKVHLALDWLSDGRLISCTHVTSPGVGRPFWDLVQSYDDWRVGWEGSHVIVYDPRTGEAEDWGIPVPRADFCIGGLDIQKENYYMADYVTGRLVRLNLETREVRDYGNIRYGAGGKFVWDRLGRMYFFTANGRAWRFTPETEQIEALNVFLPRPQAAVEARLKTTMYYPSSDPDGVVYGDVAYHGRLCRYDLMAGPEGRMDDLGMPIGEWDPSPKFQPPGVGGVCFAPDGYLYLTVAEGSASGVDTESRVNVRMMRYNPKSGVFQDLGTIYRDGWGAVCISHAVPGRDEKVYFADCGYTDHPPRLIALDTRKIADATKPVENGAYSYSVRLGDPRNEEGWEACRRNACHITSERMRCYDLDHEKIPFGSMAVSNLFFDSHGRLCGTVGGNEARLFRMDGDYRLEQAVVIPDARAVMPGMCVSHNHTAHGVAWGDSGVCIFSCPLDGDMKDLRVVNPDIRERLSASLVLPDLNTAYLLDTNGSFWKSALTDGKTRELARFRPRVSRVLVRAADGYVYGQEYEGALFRVLAGNDKVEDTHLRLPAQMGRDYMTVWTAAATLDGRLMYGGNQDGYLFSFEPFAHNLKNLGKPCMNVGISVLVSGPDGWLYGIAGDEKNVAHLFRYHPDEGFHDEGWIRHVPFWHCSVIEAMVFARDGRLFLGQAETVSRVVAMEL